ncbi:M23/M56 family metallopeptidase [Pseudoalteromonas neustonica]|uniref:M23/M56 family metallopeptidase n=1 Tax=Pseudoalteromonas neustonica TaxID=1840331 RepID=A0ABU9U6D9_9GAMM
MSVYGLLSTFIIPLLVCFISSAVLAGLSVLVKKHAKNVYEWSRFWLLLAGLSLLPILPLSILAIDTVIPVALLQSIEGASPMLVGTHANFDAVEIHNNVFVNSVYCVFGILLCSFLYGFYTFITGVVAIKRVINNAKNITNLSIFSINQQAFIMKKHINIKVSEINHSPFVFGLFSHVLVLPNTIEKMSPVQQQLLLEHELMHIHRNDNRTVLLFRLICCVFWFNPFIKWFERRFLMAMELNCDAAVLAKNPDHKMDYAKTLLVSLRLNKAIIPQASSSFFGDPLGSKAEFEQRIRAAMLDQPRFRFKIQNVFILLCFCVISSGFMVFAQSPNMTVNEEKGFNPVMTGWISSDFDDVNSFRGDKPHQGIDFAAPTGTNIIASFSGKVIIADNTSLHKNYGTVILIEHNDRKQSLYAHLSALNVKTGQVVKSGDVIGKVGQTGRTTGPHLHFELLENNQRLNPNLYLNL